jgi:hypothetical protein
MRRGFCVGGADTERAGLDMSAPSNDKIERHYFERFRQTYSLPNGRIAYGDKPDVKLTGRRKIGIEIRNFFLQPGSDIHSEQRQKPLREAVVAEAYKLYMNAGGQAIGLTFCFDGRFPIEPARRRSLPKELSILAKKIESQTGDILLELDQTPKEIVRLWNAGTYHGAKWTATKVHSVVPMSMDDLESIIREKEAKASGYEGCDAYWLLIVVDGIDAAQEQEVRIDRPHVDSTIFEKIIVFHTFGHTIEVK